MTEPRQAPQSPQSPQSPQAAQQPVRQPHKPQRRVPGVVMAFAFIFVAGLGYMAGYFNLHADSFGSGSLSSLFGTSEGLDLSSVQETYRAVATNFDGKIDKTKLIEGANRGLVAALGDPYTVFMNAQEATDFDNSLTGNIGGGVGVEVGLRNSVPTVLRVLKDNPAEKAGVQVGDVITAVNDEDVSKLTVEQVVSKIRGEADTTVKLTVNRSGDTKDFSITRQVVNNPSAYGEVKDGVGVLTITRFDNETGSLARQVARDFVKQGVTAVVLDLRGNGGGYVTAAQEVAGIWLDNELVVSERQNGKIVEELKTKSDSILGGMPTVVLVNESSASASEIVAGALRDHKAATLMGSTTFGKGSVQKMVYLPDSAMLKVTIARWYTPAGVNISETGITPDVAVARTPDDINAGRDPQLEAALRAHK